jgi:hypothetical protein
MLVIWVVRMVTSGLIELLQRLPSDKLVEDIVTTILVSYPSFIIYNGLIIFPEDRFFGIIVRELIYAEKIQIPPSQLGLSVIRRYYISSLVTAV